MATKVVKRSTEVAPAKASQLALGVPVSGLEKSGSQLTTKANRLQVLSAVDYAAAGELLLQVKALRKSIQTAFEEPKAKAYETHKSISRLEKDLLAMPTEAESTIALKMMRWQKQEQEKQELQARKEAEAERKKEIKQLQRKGDTEALEELQDSPLEIAAVVAAPRVAGLSTRSTWKFKVTDETLIPRDYLCVDEVKIGAQVRAFKQMTRIPGVEVYEDQTLVGGRG